MRAVTPRDVQIALNERDKARLAWQRAGGRAVEEYELNKAQQVVDGWTRAVQQDSGARYWHEAPSIAYYRWLVLLRRPLAHFGWSWYVVALILAGALFTVALLGMALVAKKLTLVIGVAFLVFIVSFAAGALFTTVPTDNVLLDRLGKLQRSRAARLANLTTHRQLLDHAEKSYQKLAKEHALHKTYEKAELHYQDVRRRFEDRRNQLKLRDWRSLRGIDFEQFLMEVFEVLGHAVETTKATGDQGVDLIATTRARRLAIQAKGYANSVGNGAVQEAYAGMKYYGCNACVVITNSKFTRGAIDLAQRTGCLLIDDQQIPDLIDGTIL